MIQKTTIPQIMKQRLTAFVDPILVKRAKVRGALEGLTISEVVEKALEEYAPKLEKDADQKLHLKFVNGPTIENLLTEKDMHAKRIADKRTKTLVVPR
jgi:hypothetical protein